MKKGEGHEVET